MLKSIGNIISKVINSLSRRCNNFLSPSIFTLIMFIYAVFFILMIVAYTIKINNMSIDVLLSDHHYDDNGYWEYLMVFI